MTGTDVRAVIERAIIAYWKRAGSLVAADNEASAILDELQSHGLAVVPVEPTEAMCEAFRDHEYETDTHIVRPPAAIWRAMLAAAPGGTR